MPQDIYVVGPTGTGPAGGHHSHGMRFASTGIAVELAAIAADAVHLRPFEPSDLPAAHTLSSTLHWPHRIEDRDFALSLGQGAVAERDGKVLGAALSWQSGANHATIGVSVVTPRGSCASTSTSRAAYRNGWKASDCRAPAAGPSWSAAAPERGPAHGGRALLIQAIG